MSGWHQIEPTGSEWYSEFETDSAMLGPAAAEADRFPHEPKRGPKFSCSPELAAAIGLADESFEAREWQRRLDDAAGGERMRAMLAEHFARVDARYIAENSDEREAERKVA